MEESSEKDLVFLVFLVFAFFVFTGFANLHRPFRMVTNTAGAVLSDSTSSNSVTPTPTPTTTSDSSGSGGSGSGDTGSGGTLTVSNTPTPTSTTSSGSTSSGESTTSTNVTPTPTPFTDSTSSGTSSTSGDNSTTSDRLASVDSATLSCIKSRLTSSEFDTLRFLVPTNNTEEETLKLLKEKASVCFTGYSEATSINQATSFVSELPKESEDCLRKTLGDNVFKEISSGLRKPTLDEKAKAEACFSNSSNSIKFQTQEQTLSGDIEKCLLLALGSKRFTDIKKGRLTPTLDEREKAQRCFGASTNPLKPHVTYELPGDVKSCLSGQVNPDRFEELKQGKDKPTETEKEGVKSCLADLNKIQTKIIPAPSEEVPFMDEDTERINIESTFTETVKAEQITEDKRLVLSGRGPKNSIVDLYIYSDPIVVTTQTDDNGDFVYRMNEPLTSGKHIAYAVYKQNNGTSVRSSVYNFDVTAASKPSDNLLNENQVSAAPSKFMVYAIAFIVSALGLSAIGIYFAFRTKKAADSVNGENDSEGGTGTVN